MLVYLRKTFIESIENTDLFIRARRLFEKTFEHLNCFSDVYSSSLGSKEQISEIKALIKLHFRYFRENIFCID